MGYNKRFYRCLRIFCCFILIVLLSFQPCLVFASEVNRPQQTGSVEEENPFLGFIEFTGECMYNLLMATGAIIGDVTEIDTLADICRSRLIETGVIIQDSNTNNYYIQETISASTLLELRNLIEQEMKSKEPITTYYPSTVKPYYEDINILGGRMPKDASSYAAMRSILDKYGAVGFSNIYHPYIICIDFSKFYYAYQSSNSICFVDKELQSVTPVVVYDKTDWLNFVGTADDFNALIKEYSDGGTSTQFGIYIAGPSMPTYRSRFSGINGAISGRSINVFNSMADLYNYVKGKPTAYYTSDYYNKTYNDITLNQETIKNYTTQNVQNIYNTVNNNAGDALSSDELQSIIDSTVAAELDKINGSLDDVNDSLKGVNAALDKILKSLDKSGEELKTQTSWLEKIYKVLKHMDETLLVISSDLDEILEDDGLLDQQTSILSLTAVLNIFLYGIPEPEEEPAPASVFYDDLSGEYVEEPVVLSARYASRSGGGVIGLMFDKFPFCVPWDVYYCFLSLAETPEAPHFTFPFVIDSMGFRYEFNFNLSRFSMLSELSRMFLTLTFVVYMTHLTKKIVGGK